MAKSRDKAPPHRSWFSRRALLLHLEVAIVAPGCVIAGWWQATRALAGNGLSWFYSVEWPIFAIFSVVGWWYLIHEDPEEFRSRRWIRRHDNSDIPASAGSTAQTVSVQVTTARLANLLGVLVGVEFVLGLVVLFAIPINRPSGFVPTTGAGWYVAHVTLGLPLGLGATVLLLRTRGQARIARLSGIIGGIGVLTAAIGGLLAASHSLRFTGIAVMLLGTIPAGIGYLFPTLEKHDN